MRKILFILIGFLFLASCEDDKKIINLNDEPEDKKEIEEPLKPQQVKRSTLPILHTDGRWLCNEAGEHVNLHGFWQTYSPWFNGDAWGEHNWGDYNVEECLAYNKRIIDGVLASGYEMDFMRMHMDSYWSLKRTRYWGTPLAEYQDYDETLFKKYLDEVFVPMMKYIISKGMRVVLMPGYSNEVLKKGDEFNDVLKSLWTNIASHEFISNNMDIMFEVVNEPVRIIDANGVEGSNDDSHNKALTEYMQDMVDHIRKYASENMIWVSGTGYQSCYAGFVKYKIKDHNYGFAVHCYPGWYGSDAEEASAELGGAWGGGFESFRSGWEEQIGAAAKVAPIMITEEDWAPKEYDKSWGKSYTGYAGGYGFGANFKWLADHTGNVSYITFCAPNDLALFSKYGDPSKPDNYWNDWRGCPWQIHKWYKDYKEGRVQPETAEELVVGGIYEGKIAMQQGNKRTLIANAINDGGRTVSPIMHGAVFTSANSSVAKVEEDMLIAVAPGKTKIHVEALGISADVDVEVTAFDPFLMDKLNANIWEKGTWDEKTQTLVTGQYGFGGWQYSPGLDLSNYSRLVCELGDGSDMSCSPSLRMFDGGGYWASAVETNFVNRTATIEISNDMKKENGNSFDIKNVTIIGIWTLGGKPIEIKKIYLE